MQDGEQADQGVVRPEPLTAADLIPDRVLQPEDQDAFEYAAIAARVADLVSVAPAPMNVALFGPWGSGKSSFAELLRRALAGRKEKVRLVRYDAWKYGGASLQRNFISHVARELGLDEESPANRQFFRGLYEKRRIAEIDPTRLRDNWQTIAAWFVGAVIIFSALFFAALAVIAAVSSKNFSTLVSKHYVGFFTSTAVIAVVVTMAKLLLDGLRVDIEQSAPADEEFTATFGRLVKAGLENQTRIVFFIDELDRCSRQEVVATLADIKNFLDQPSCVFIVAADREVLERALTTLPQSIPVDEDAPYYSSASEFLDKVFQHEAVLPPLRVRRLTRFARDLVLAQSTSGGLWSELRGAPDKKLLDKVIYALIPSHVRSPRRIKVLLNRFATNARIVQARGIDWLDRAEQIAKLTVLQTEFPLLAADLHVEPRLPSLLLAPPSNPAPRLKRLLARHRIPTTAEAIAVEEPTATAAAATSEATPGTAPAGVPAAASETDPLLVEDEEETRLLASVQRLQLRRYLQRAAAAAIPDPARDLLYLEAAGAAVGLEDSELGDVIESAAPDAPGDVLAVLESRTVDERRAAARLLADMSHQLFGTEQENVVTTMLGVAEQLGDDVQPVADEVAAALRSFLEEQDLDEEQLVGALLIARLVEAGQPEAPLTQRLFADNRLLEDEDRVKAIALLADRLPDANLQQVRKAVAELVPTSIAALTQPLQELPEEAALGLLEAPVPAAITSHVKALEAAGGAGADAFVDELIGVVSARAEASPLVRAAVQWPLLTSATAAGYRAALSGVDVISELSEQSSSSHALVGLRQAPPADWKVWRAHLSADPHPWDKQAERAADAVGAIVQRFPTAEPSEQLDAVSVIEALIPYLLIESSEDLWAVIQPQLSAALSATQWWTAPAARETEARLHALARSLRAFGSEVEDSLETMLLADAQRAIPYAAGGTEVLAGVREMGQHLGTASLEQLATDAAGIATSADLQFNAERTLTMLTLARSAQASGADISDPPFAVSPGDVINAASTGTSTGNEAVVVWLQLDPPFDAIKAAPAALGTQAPQSVITAFGDWAAKTDEPTRTELLLAVLERPGPTTSAWIAAISSHPYDEERVVDAVAEKVRAAPRAEERMTHARLLVALRPSRPAAQRKVATLVLWLLERDTDVDFNIAVETVPALGTEHRSAGRLDTAFRTAVDRGRRIPARNEDDFRRANLKLPQKAFKAKRTGRKIGPFRLP